jgi:hypothetical protein
MNQEMALSAKENHVCYFIAQLRENSYWKDVVHFHLTDFTVMTTYLTTATRLFVST